MIRLGQEREKKLVLPTPPIIAAVYEALPLV